MAEKKTPDHPYEIGAAYLVRTVTHYYTGRLKAVTAGELVLGEAAWIPDTGRFSGALATGELREAEPYPDVAIVSRGAIVDVAPWAHPLPRTAK